MASSLARTKHMKRMESKKSHSWWWDSHISPKNSKWLAENLEEMDHSVKRMLKLIEEDADSFAKKAEMYYKKRPELISLVEEFYRVYRSLAERYDHVTGELKKNVPSDLQSQGSGVSDISSELPSPGPSPDQRPSRSKSGARAAGFSFFLGSGGSSSDLNKEGDESSTVDSDSESDDSSINNYSGISGNGDDQVFRRKVAELEIELRDVKEKLRAQQQENGDGSIRGNKNGNSEDLLAKIAEYDEELRLAKENIRNSEDEINRLKMELQKYESSGFTANLQVEQEISEKEVGDLGSNLEVDKEQVAELIEKIGRLEAELADPESKIHLLEEDLKLTKEKLRVSEKEVESLKLGLESSLFSTQGLQDQLGLAQKEVGTWKGKLDRERREVSKLQDRIVRYKANLSDRDQEIRVLKETIGNANKSLSEENSELQSEISKLCKERTYLEDSLKEWGVRCQSLEEEVRRVKAGKTEMEVMLVTEIEQLKAALIARDDRVEELNKILNGYKSKYDSLIAERHELNAKILALTAEVSSRDDRISEMNNHFHQLHMEHVELISEAEAARKLVEESGSRAEMLEREVERQKVVISEGAEEKREAIRQLCFSLEHYRDGYHRLRQAFVGHKRLPVMAS